MSTVMLILGGSGGRCRDSIPVDDWRNFVRTTIRSTRPAQTRIISAWQPGKYSLKMLSMVFDVRLYLSPFGWWRDLCTATSAVDFRRKAGSSPSAPCRSCAWNWATTAAAALLPYSDRPSEPKGRSGSRSGTSNCCRRVGPLGDAGSRMITRWKRWFPTEDLRWRKPSYRRQSFYLVPDGWCTKALLMANSWCTMNTFRYFHQHQQNCSNN